MVGYLSELDRTSSIAIHTIDAIGAIIAKPRLFGLSVYSVDPLRANISNKRMRFIRL